MAAALAALAMASLAAAADLPKVAVRNIRPVFHNGEHNAFTDLVQFQDRYYLTFRSCPDGHMAHPTSSIIVLCSTDTKKWDEKWDEVHRFRVAKRDTRDPHFLVFRDRLFVYTGTWYSGTTALPRAEYDLNKHLGTQGPETSMCWLANDALHEFAELPSGGDNSYPGFIALGPSRAMMSWYSSHEKDAGGKTITAIYMADLEIVRWRPFSPQACVRPCSRKAGDGSGDSILAFGRGKS